MKYFSFLITIMLSFNKITYLFLSEISLQILNGSCECPVGINPAICKHFFAVAYLLEDYARKELFDAPTDKLQMWHRPTKKQFSPKKAEDAFGVEASRKPVNLCFNHDALKKLPGNMSIFHVIENSAELSYSSSLGLPAMPFAGDICTQFCDFLSFEEILFISDELIKTISDCISLEKDTIGQTSCALWFNERRKRLTASNFHRVINRKDGFEMLAAELLNPKDISHIPAVKYGRDMEPIVRNKIRNRYLHENLRSVGLVVNPQFPFLGCSPDALLYSIENGPTLVEIKCVLNPSNLSLSELSRTRKDFCLEFDDALKVFTLKKNHKYMTQIQGQMGICHLDKCLFVLHFSMKNTFTEIVYYNEKMWNTILPSLKLFYFTYYIKYIVKK